MYAGSCSSQGSGQGEEQIKQNFLKAVNSDFLLKQLLCLSSQGVDCKVENVKVMCCDVLATLKDVMMIIPSSIHFCVSCYSSGLLWENHFHAQKKGRQFPGHTVRHYHAGSQPGGQCNRPEGQTAGSGARARRTRVEHQHSSTTGSGSSRRRQPRPSARRAGERRRVVSCGDGCGDQAGERVGHPSV